MEPVLINIAKRLFERRIEEPEMKFSRSVAGWTLYDFNVHEQVTDLHVYPNEIPLECRFKCT